MSGGNRSERVAQEIRQILGDLLVRGDIKDPRVQDAGLVTFTHVRVTGDLSRARVSFMVHGASPATLHKVQAGLRSAGGYLRRVVGAELRLRSAPTLEFQVDGVFEQEEKVDRLLQTISHDAATEKK